MARIYESIFELKNASLCFAYEVSISTLKSKANGDNPLWFWSALLPQVIRVTSTGSRVVAVLGGGVLQDSFLGARFENQTRMLPGCFLDMSS